jgi:ferredoxin
LGEEKEMIIAKRKPFAEILESISDYERILVVGCGTCVAICLAGGEKEAELLSTQLSMALKLRGKNHEIHHLTVERQCDREFIKEIEGMISEYPVLLSLACGVGVQFLAEIFDHKIVIPGVDTSFIGTNDDIGLWQERCCMCNQCYLSITGAICPVTMCPKGLLNGPCSGMHDSRCEVNRDRTCAWAMIYDRMARSGRLNVVQDLIPPMKNSRNQKPAQMVHMAYWRRYEAGK